MTSILAVRGLSAGYRGGAVVHDVDLSVGPGEIVALVGPNGAGKTTTLLAVGGVIPARAGEVQLRGERLVGPLHRRARRGLALVTEDRSVFAGLSTATNLRLGRGPAHRGLELFPELRPLLRRRAGLLSGGEQQMLTLARALAADPPLLMVDELSLGLAPLVVDRLLRGLREAADRGAGVLVVEQQARRALAVADRAYVLCRGRVELEGTGADLLGRADEVEQAYL